MASTAAFVYLKPRLLGTESAHRNTTASLDVAVRLVSGFFSNSGGINPTANLTNLKSWLPGARVKVVTSDGVMTPEWYRFIQYLVEVVLGGAAAPTVADVVSAVTTTTEGAVAATQAAQAVSQQADANAQALAAAVQVVQTAGLSGATQIPPVQLNSRMQAR
jgi:hypothetical protein